MFVCIYINIFILMISFISFSDLIIRLPGRSYMTVLKPSSVNFSFLFFVALLRMRIYGKKIHMSTCAAILVCSIVFTSECVGVCLCLSNGMSYMDHFCNVTKLEVYSSFCFQIPCRVFPVNE